MSREATNDLKYGEDTSLGTSQTTRAAGLDEPPSERRTTLVAFTLMVALCIVQSAWVVVLTISVLWLLAIV